MYVIVIDVMQTPSALTLHETRPGSTALKAKHHLKTSKAASTNDATKSLSNVKNVRKK